MKKITAAVIGLAFGEELMDEMGDCKHFELAGGYARTEATREAFADKFGVKAYSSYDEMLSDEGVEGIVIATPNDTHRDLAVRAARAGKHIFLEKPIDNTVEASRDIIGACEKAGVVLFVGHVARRASAFRTAKKMIDNGELGQVVLVETNLSHRGGMGLKEGEWRWYRERCPGGPVMQLAAHDFDTLNYLFGPIKSVCAKVKRLATPAEIEDTAVVSAEFESGILAYVGTAYTIPPTTFTNIYGTEAALNINRRRHGLVRVDKSGECTTVPVVLPVNPLADELDHFARCVLFGETPETGGEEALHALAAVLATLKSAEEERTVTLAEVLAD